MSAPADDLFSESESRADAWIKAELVRLRADKTKLRLALHEILDAVDYSAGNCRPNEMVGAVLCRDSIQRARKSLEQPQPAHLEKAR